ncbi:MAG: asparagine synthase (glutamine-hydrolyzing), partial [Flavitalea sp.]
DGEGFWLSPSGNAGFGHRRLAIIDLTDNGAQPMHFEDRYTIVYNGEIYNYKELRRELEADGIRFRSESDTEVILAGYSKFGADCCTRFDGMFAFAIWDEKERVLFAARDRFGEKPFCYHIAAGSLWFASEAKAIRVIKKDLEIDPDQLIRFLTIGHTRNPADPAKTLYKSIQELPAAHTLTFRAGDKEAVIKRYWELNIRTGKHPDEKAATEQFGALLKDSVNKRLRSDVPLGSSLSGGLDSSSIVAIMQQSGIQNLDTFSAIFPGYERDESANINTITGMYNCRSHFTRPDVNDLVKLLPQILYHQETPVSSASIFAQYKVFELAKQNGVTVLLDGQGADETLGGYTNQLQWGLQEIYRKSGADLKTNLRALGSEGVPYEWGLKNKISAWLPSFTAGVLKQREKRKVASDEFISKEYLDAYYDPAGFPDKPVINNLNDILFHHTTQSGLNELLHYADRNSMAHGREVRLPFLNHELVQFVFSLPVHYKIRDGYTKWILRNSMNNILPAQINWQRTKIGFDPPQKSWMQQPELQTMIFEARASLVEKGVLSKRAVSKKIQPHDTHAADNYDWRFLVTDLLLKL